MRLARRLGAIIQVANRIERLRRMQNILEWTLMGAITEDVAEAVVEYEDRGRSAEELMIIVGQATRDHMELLAKFRSLPHTAQDAITANAQPFPTAARGDRRGTEPGARWLYENGGQEGRVWVYPRPPPEEDQMGENVAEAAVIAARCNSESSLREFEAALQAARGAAELDEETATALSQPNRVAPGRASVTNEDGGDGASSRQASSAGGGGSRAGTAGGGRARAAPGKAGRSSSLGSAALGLSTSQMLTAASSPSGRFTAGNAGGWRVRAVGGLHRAALAVQEKLAHSILRVGRWAAMAGGGGGANASTSNGRRAAVLGSGGRSRGDARGARPLRTTGSLQSVQEASRQPSLPTQHEGNL